VYKPFCFSLDRENFQGEFATREHARDAGYAAAAAAPSAVEAIFVAKRQPINPQADHHAETVVADMQNRMRIKFGEETYLTAANEHQLADLDAAIEYAVVEWLARHRLTPEPKWVSLSEYPVSNPHEHAIV